MLSYLRRLWSNHHVITSRVIAALYYALRPPRGPNQRRLVGSILTLYGSVYVTGILGCHGGAVPWDDPGFIYLPLWLGGLLLVSAGLALLLTGSHYRYQRVGHLAAVYATAITTFTAVGWWDRYPPLAVFICLIWACLGEAGERWEV